MVEEGELPLQVSASADAIGQAEANVAARRQQPEAYRYLSMKLALEDIE